MTQPLVFYDQEKFRQEVMKAMQEVRDRFAELVARDERLGTSSQHTPKPTMSPAPQPDFSDLFEALFGRRPEHT